MIELGEKSIVGCTREGRRCQSLQALRRFDGQRRSVRELRIELEGKPRQEISQQKKKLID